MLWLLLIVPLAGFTPGLSAAEKEAAAPSKAPEKAAPEKAAPEKAAPAADKEGDKTEDKDSGGGDKKKEKDHYGDFMGGKNDVNWFITSNLWLLLAAALVFIMHLGFSTLESGLTRSKNTGPTASSVFRRFRRCLC